VGSDAGSLAQDFTDRSLIPNFAIAAAEPCNAAHHTAARFVSAS
jgi:hypothetical protein